MDPIGYKEGVTELEEIFEEFDYGGLIEEGRTHAASVDVHTCQSGAIISLSFPGYKAKQRDTTDYRVDIQKDGYETSLSHANILLDIFQKVRTGRVPPDPMNEFIESVGHTGRLVPKDLPEAMRTYEAGSPPPNQLLDTVSDAHPRGDSFNRGGSRWDLDVEELTHSMFWIVLQEDVNYPMPRFEGRKMPLSRYIEASWAAHNEPELLVDVVDRALAKGYRPRPWPQVDYGRIPELTG